MGHRLNIGDKGHRVRAGEARGWPFDWLERPTEHDHHAREKGLRDGHRGEPSGAELRGPFAGSYVAGYRNGSWWRYSERTYGRRGADHFKLRLFCLIYHPRYPHEEPTWTA